MVKDVKEEKYRWIKAYFRKKDNNKGHDICPFSERSLKYWLEAFRKQGMDKSTRPKILKRLLLG